MRTLITGGAGFIGSHLCERFLAEGHVVLLAGTLSDAEYRVPIRRLEDGGADPSRALLALHDERSPADYVALDVRTAPAALVAALGDLTPLAAFGSDGRYRLLGAQPLAAPRPRRRP